MGKITTSSGNYNKELLIVEKYNDGKVFELHSTSADKAEYIKIIRNAWLTIFILSIFGVFINIIFSITSVILFFPTILYQIEFLKYKHESNIQE